MKQLLRIAAVAAKLSLDAKATVRRLDLEKLVKL